jgi:hypothetical protein
VFGQLCLFTSLQSLNNGIVFVPTTLLRTRPDDFKNGRHSTRRKESSPNEEEFMETLLKKMISGSSNIARRVLMLGRDPGGGHGKENHSY